MNGKRSKSNGLAKCDDFRRISRGWPSSPCAAAGSKDKRVTSEGLTSIGPGLKYPKFPAYPTPLRAAIRDRPLRIMKPTAVATPSREGSMNQCKHPRVQIVSRDEDTEYVECLECGEVFESSEFKDMAIEERAQPDDV